VPPAKKPAEELFAPGMMKFQDSDVLQVLIIYQELTGRTVLRPNDLPSKKISVRSQTALTRKEAAWLLEAVLFAQGGLTAFREADKFVFVIPSDRKGGLPRIDSPAAPPDGTSFAPGLMNFQDAAIEQVVGVYATLSGQEALPLAPQVPRAKLSIRNQQALSKAEAMFALEAVAALNGLRFESLAGEKVQVVPAPVKAINSR
jgi:type II secretory pathway component GspD/PulD (secretin)